MKIGLKKLIVLLALIAVLGTIMYVLISNSETTTPDRSPINTDSLPQSTDSNTLSKNSSSTHTITEIRTGTSFSECEGYCEDEWIIHPGEIVYIESNWDTSIPEKRQEFPITLEIWEGLLSSLNVESFNALPKVIGCPGCADGGTQWVEISDGVKTKRVTFDIKQSPAEISSFMNTFRNILQGFSF